MLVPLAQARGETCGAKAAAIAGLLRAGLPAPDGFVVPFVVYRETVGQLVRRSIAEGPKAAREAIAHLPLPPDVLVAIERALAQLAAPAVAVRSSAAGEDGHGASAAGQYDSILAVQGLAGVADALRTCWASLYTSRAVAYRTDQRSEAWTGEEPAMAVIVQTHVDADVSGVMFTADEEEQATTIEAAWGLGPSVVSGSVTPDRFRIHTDGTITRRVADKPTRLDRDGARLVVRTVDLGMRGHPTLDDEAAADLANLGRAAAAALGGPQDIEWAIADGLPWLLQARPITAAAPPDEPSAPDCSNGILTGTPGSHGTVTGTARTVRGPSDFARVRAGDILVCPVTDPAWTPLLRLAAGVVTETGGALSHAAIIARERRIPAVLGVPDALTVISDGSSITIDGLTGTVRIRGGATEPRAGDQP